jgi:hypothetical protein
MMANDFRIGESPYSDLNAMIKEEPFAAYSMSSRHLKRSFRPPTLPPTMGGIANACAGSQWVVRPKQDLRSSRITSDALRAARRETVDGDQLHDVQSKGAIALRDDAFLAQACARVARRAAGVFDRVASPSCVHCSYPTAPHGQAAAATGATRRLATARCRHRSRACGPWQGDRRRHGRACSAAEPGGWLRLPPRRRGMTESPHAKPPANASQIDIELWARDLRWQWFKRAFQSALTRLFWHAAVSRITRRSGRRPARPAP